jgi:ribosomal protein L11 methyltransferase
VKTWPALDVLADAADDRLLVEIDDFAPAAVEERDDATRIFFAASRSRDAAAAALSGRYRCRAVDVPDEDWARRSQQDLQPVTVGRITIVPPWHGVSHQPSAITHQPLTIVIAPSMGFGTGHHETTRLCLAALQRVEISGALVVDVGTGSGVLAIAAAALGARRAVGIDSDPDAVRSAQDNVALNAGAVAADRLQIVEGDVTAIGLPQGDVVLANLTGALLVREAVRLFEAVARGGTLIVSGLQADERDGVAGAFAPLTLVGEDRENSWIALTFRKA